MLIVYLMCMSSAGQTEESEKPTEEKSSRCNLTNGSSASNTCNTTSSVKVCRNVDYSALHSFFYMLNFQNWYLSCLSMKCAFIASRMYVERELICSRLNFVSSSALRSWKEGVEIGPTGNFWIRHGRNSLNNIQRILFHSITYVLLEVVNMLWTWFSLLDYTWCIQI
jgi:hypothetical protein